MAEALQTVGSAAAIAQLLGQTTNLIGSIQRTRARVDGLPQRIQQHDRNLDALLRTLTLIRNERELQTEEIYERVQDVTSVVGELEGEIQRLHDRQRLSRARLYASDYASGTSGDVRSIDYLSQLEVAMKRLDTSIAVINVRLTGSIWEGWRAVVPVIESIDERLREVQDGRIRTASFMRSREVDEAEYGPTGVENHVPRNIEVLKDSRMYIANKAYNHGKVLNSNIGTVSRKLQTIDQRRYESNLAWNEGLVINGDIGADAIGMVLNGKVC